MNNPENIWINDNIVWYFRIEHNPFKTINQEYIYKNYDQILIVTNSQTFLIHIYHFMSECLSRFPITLIQSSNVRNISQRISLNWYMRKWGNIAEVAVHCQ
jgi:hypothetical protein